MIIGILINLIIIPLTAKLFPKTAQIAEFHCASLTIHKST